MKRCITFAIAILLTAAALALFAPDRLASNFSKALAGEVGDIDPQKNKKG